MSPAPKPNPTTLPESGPSLNPEGHHTCMRCPVCASEACRTLQDLGMYCETQCAASLAQAQTAQKAGVRGSAAA